MSECTRTEERLVDYLDGALSPREHEALESHTASCRACSAVLRESRSILEAYRSVPDDDVSAEVARKLLAAARLPAIARRPRRRALALVAAAAAVLVTVAVLWFGRGTSSDPIADALRDAGSHLASGELGTAITSYEKALALARGDVREAEILQRLAELHLERSEFASALARLERLVSARPDHANLEAVLLLRGRALEGLGDREQALELYRVVADEFPSSRDEALRKISALEGPVIERAEELQALGYGAVGYGD